MAFETLDLGRILQTAEAIKGMRREAETSKLRDQYLQTNIGNAQQAGVIQANQELRAQDDQASQIDERTAKQHYLAASHIEASPDPVRAAMQFAPDLVQAFEKQNGAGSFAQLQPEVVKHMVSDAKARAAIAARIEPAKAERFTLGQGQQRFGADGKPIAAVAPAPRKGLKISSDGAGGFSLYEGDDAEGVQLGAPPKNALQTGAINAQAGIDRLHGIRQGFDPKWLTYKEQAKQFANSVRAKAQGLPFVSNLKPEEQSDLASFSRFKSDTLDNLNRYITEITGAAMGVEEAKRIVATMPSLDDDPSSFQSKMDRVEQRLKLVIARSVYTQKKGIKFDAMPIEKMQQVMNQRGDELYKQKLAETKDPNAAKAATVETLQSEFFQ